jgi:dolichyl-phosphate-mannose-protein mannosyltransferase
VRALVSGLNRPVVAIIAVTILAAGLRFVHLSHPDGYVFDEVYYPKAGCILLGWSNKTCTVESDDEKYWRDRKWDVGSWVHPPLGKWEIALGIKAFGMREFGWRFSSAVAGTAVVLLTALIAQVLFGSAVWTFAAGLLIAVEHLNVVMSRTGLLDVHLEFWVLLGFLFVLLDRRWLERRQAAADAGATPTPPDDDGSAEPSTPSPVVSPVWRPWRFAAGAALGAAMAVKWSGAFALFAVLLLAMIWETSRRHRGAIGWSGAFGRALARESFGIVLALILTPILIYLLTWAPWMHHFGWDWHEWVKNMGETWRFHRSGIEWTKLDPNTELQTPTHPYYARAWKWILLLRPISFYVKDYGPDTEQILAIGSPFLFWGSVVAIPFVALAWRRLRDWRAGFLTIALLGQYVPWFLQGRPTFFFYVLPLTPFMVLGVTYVLREASDATIVVREPDTGEVALHPDTGSPAISTAHVYRPFVWVYLIAVVITFAWFWPILTAGRISDLHVRSIVWFRAWI